MILCPRCKLPMDEDEALDSLLAQTKTVKEFLRLLHDGKTVVCSTCSQIEGLKIAHPARAEALIIAQRRAQAAYYGLDRNGQPKLPQ